MHACICIGKAVRCVSVCSCMRHMCVYVCVVIVFMHGYVHECVIFFSIIALYWQNLNECHCVCVFLCVCACMYIIVCALFVRAYLLVCYSTEKSQVFPIHCNKLHCIYSLLIKYFFKSVV